MTGSGTSTQTAGKYWYHTTIYYCPICTGESKYRGRVYETEKPRPEAWEDRNEVIESWDYCDAL